MRYAKVVKIGEHLQISGTALRNWLIGQIYDALIVGLLWLTGLHWIGVPAPWLWALVAAILQLIPIIGAPLALIGPMTTALISSGPERMLYVLLLYGGIALVDGILLQPFIFKRTARIPVWASILTPLVLGAFFNVWGVVLSVPLLAVVYAYRARKATAK
jgi:predicted PurR-regulated permease PerM